MFGIIDKPERIPRPQPPAPDGFRRRDAICGVAAPRRSREIDFVAAPPQMAPRRSERGRAQYSDRLLAFVLWFRFPVRSSGP
jgi:hypothetical protein